MQFAIFLSLGARSLSRSSDFTYIWWCACTDELIFQVESDNLMLLLNNSKQKKSNFRYTFSLIICIIIVKSISISNTLTVFTHFGLPNVFWILVVVGRKRQDPKGHFPSRFRLKIGHNFNTRVMTIPGRLNRRSTLRVMSETKATIHYIFIHIWRFGQCWLDARECVADWHSKWRHWPLVTVVW